MDYHVWIDVEQLELLDVTTGEMLELRRKAVPLGLALGPTNPPRKLSKCSSAICHRLRT